MTPTINARSARYLNLAGAYVMAARGILEASDFERVRLPFYGLLGQGIELGLKGVIARSGWDEERLMWVGHDLAWAWRLAQIDDGFEASGADAVRAVIGQLSRPHHAQAFRYPQYLSWPLPDPWQSLDAAEAYLDRARRVVAEP